MWPRLRTLHDSCRGADAPARWGSFSVGASRDSECRFLCWRFNKRMLMCVAFS